MLIFSPGCLAKHQFAEIGSALFDSNKVKIVRIPLRLCLKHSRNACHTQHCVRVSDRLPAFEDCVARYVNSEVHSNFSGMIGIFRRQRKRT